MTEPLRPAGPRPATPLSALADFAPERQRLAAESLEPTPTGVPSRRADGAAPAPAAASRAAGGESWEYGESHDAYDHTQMGRFARIVAFHAGVSTPSTSQMLAERLAQATRAALEGSSRVASVEVIGLRPLVNDIALASVGGPVSAELQTVIDALAAADGVIAVSPVFQSSYSGLFKSFIDVLPEGTLRGVPVLLGATAGTARHSLVTEMALRPLFAYLKAYTTSLAVFAASEDFGASWDQDGSSGREAPLGDRIDRAGAELASFIERFPRQAPVDALADFTPMGDLLARRR